VNWTNVGRLALAWDPGPTRSAWAIVGEGPGGLGSYVGSGVVLSADVDGWRGRLAWAAESVAVVGVEVPEALHPRAGASLGNLFARSRQLLATARVAATIAAEGRVKGLQVLELSAGKWRHALTGRNNASGERIRGAIGLYCAGVPGRTNEHTRDAIGLGLVTLWWSGGRRP